MIAKVGFQSEVWGQLLQAGSLDLKLAQVVRGHLIKNLKGDFVPVNDICPKSSYQVELLATPKDVVKDHKVDIVPLDVAVDLPYLSTTDVVLREWAVSALNDVPYDLDVQGLDQSL